MTIPCRAVPYQFEFGFLDYQTELPAAEALSAAGTVIDSSNAPGLTVIVDQDGNEGIVCSDTSAATTR